MVNPSSLGLKRARPLMIDSHSANRFMNADDDDQIAGDINEIDDEDEEEFSKFNGSAILRNKRRQQLVELEDDDEDEEDNDSHSNGRNKKKFSYIDDNEIETINTNKTNGDNFKLTNGNNHSNYYLIFCLF